MGDKSAIEWTNATWNPIRARNLATGKIGWHCEHATTGCEFCYAEGMNKRLGTGLPFKPGHRKDIEIFLDEEMLLAPLRWRKPRMIFPCSMTDMFAPFVKDEWLDKMFAVMALCADIDRKHIFQILTKRFDRMRAYIESKRENAPEWIHLPSEGGKVLLPYERGVPNYIWLGVSAERQQEWDERKEHLRNTPAAIHFASFEPLLGSIVEPQPMSDFIQWAIVGGESGPKARPALRSWYQSIRDQCQRAGVTYFHKQNGEWIDADEWLDILQCGPSQLIVGGKPWKPARPLNYSDAQLLAEMTGRKDRYQHNSDGTTLLRVGKHAAGRLLDGREWNEFPQQQVRTAA